MLIRPWGKQIFHSLETSTNALSEAFGNQCRSKVIKYSIFWPCHLFFEFYLMKGASAKEMSACVMIMIAALFMIKEKPEYTKSKNQL